MRCDGNAGILSPTKKGNGPSSRDEEGEPGLFLSCGRTLSVPLECRQVVGVLLELPQGCQGPFRVSRRKVGFHSRCRSGKGPHLALRGECPGFSRVGAANVSLESYDRDLRDPLVGASGKSSLHARFERLLRIPLQSLPGPRSSSGVETGISGFLFSADMDLGVPLWFPQGSQSSSRVEICTSTLLSSWKSSVSLPVGLL